MRNADLNTRARSDALERQETVREYYGEVLQSNADLKTSACCSPQALPKHLREVLSQIHPEVCARFYGCGLPIPPVLKGATVLDLGCGSGRDCYLLSKLVGPESRVLGVDMTAPQLEVAHRHRDYHAQAFGYRKSNVEFLLGDIADLRALGIANESVDVVVSNCVLNLAADKRAVLAETFRVLKPGGELYFSDVFADRRIPPDRVCGPVLVGECLAGALYIEDFRRLVAELGCLDARQCAHNPIILEDEEIERKIGMVRFSSITWRVFKLPLEDRCEDYGQIAIYRGDIPEHPHTFMLDDHHRFETGKPMSVCGNTADMLSHTRYAKHFQVLGDKHVHYGLFDCAPAAVTTASTGCC